MRSFCAGFLTAWAIAASTLTAANWPGFRGPNSSGVGSAEALPLEFGPGKNVVWKTELPTGKSSPVLTEKHIFLTAWTADSLLTLALDRRTGKLLWERALPRGRKEHMHQLNSAASATPATDGTNVYVFFGDFGLVSYSPEGKERWRLPLGPFTNLHGMSASPIVVDDKVVLACDQDVESFVLALEKDTGKVAWKTMRPEVVHGFSTPSVYVSPRGEKQIIVPGSYVLISYSAETGEKLWWVRGLTWQVKPAALVEDGVIYATGWAPGAEPAQRKFFPAFEEAAKEADPNADGLISPQELPEKWKPTGSWRAIDLDRDGFLSARDWSFYIARRGSRNATIAVRPGDARGDLTGSHVVWDYERSVPVVPTPVLYDGLLYIVKNGGILAALDAVTGEVGRLGRLEGAIDNYYASPVAADGKLFFASETGKVTVARPGMNWTVLKVNDLGEPAYATPAIGDKRIYIRTESGLYAFGSEGQ